MGLYKPDSPVLETKRLRKAHRNLDSLDKAIISAQVDRVDTTLRTIRKKSTSFGEIAGLELMSALGRMFVRLESDRPEEWEALKGWSEAQRKRRI